MFPKCSTRRKDGKAHRSWSIVESCRYSDGRVAQRHVLYLGEINDSQRLAWEKSIAVFDEARGDQRQIALFPEDRKPDPGGTEALSLRLDQLRLENPRQWGACWLGDSAVADPEPGPVLWLPTGKGSVLDIGYYSPSLFRR